MSRLTSETLRNQVTCMREKSTYIESSPSSSPRNLVTFDDGLLQFNHGSNKFILSYWTPVSKLPLIMDESTVDSPTKQNECKMKIINENGEDVTNQLNASSALGKLLSDKMAIHLQLNELTTLSMNIESINRCNCWIESNKKNASNSTSLLQQERQMLLNQYEPMVNQFMNLVEKAEMTASNKFKWGGLFLLSSQLGFFARLIWVDYSWDVMEPITWCVTYSMMVATFAYYIIYSQEFMLPLAEKRAVQMKLFKLIQAQQNSGQFDLRTFRRLRKKLVAIEASKSSAENTAFDTLFKSGITG